MERHHAPQPARDVVAFREGIASWNFAQAVQAAERLMPLEVRGHRWLESDELRDGMVIAQLHLGDAKGARPAPSAEPGHRPAQTFTSTCSS